MQEGLRFEEAKQHFLDAAGAGGLELLSDSCLQGVLYIELDVKGAWRASLAQELSNARLPIKLEGLLGS